MAEDKDSSLSLLERELDLLRKIHNQRIDIRDAERDLAKEVGKVNMLESKINFLKKDSSKIDGNISEEIQKQIDALENKKKLAEEDVKFSERALKLEMKANRELGVAGALMKSLSGKSQLASDIYEAMSAKAKSIAEGNEESAGVMSILRAGYGEVSKKASTWYHSTSLGTKLLPVAGLAVMGMVKGYQLMVSALSKGGSLLRGLSDQSSNFVGNLTSGFSSMLKNIPLIGGLMAGIVDFAAGLLDLIIGVEDHIVRTGRQLGLTAEKSVILKDNFSKIADSSEELYVTSRALTESFASIAKSTGLNNMFSTETLKTNIELTKYAGLEADTAAELAKTSKMTGMSMKDITKSVLTQVVALEQTTGIAFNYQEILKEATSFSGRLGLQFTKYPGQLAKSLLITKAMGLDLKELNSMASGFLDFESSISKEFEAQLLTGRDINLSTARELFMNNKLAEAAAEITRQVGDSNSFLKMNRFQQDAFAEAMGMSADQMADMLKKQELFAKFGVTDQKGLLKKIDLMKSQNREAEIRAKFQDEEAYKSMVNLSMQEKLMLTFEKIKQGLVDYLTQPNIIDKIQGLVKYLSDPKNIQNVIDTARTYIGKIVGYLGDVTSLILKTIGQIANVFTIGREGDILERSFYKAARGVKSFSSEFEQKNVEDAVIFPGNKLVVNKSPEDYTIFTKNPGAQIDYNALVRAFRESTNQQPIVLKANLDIQGEPAARAIVRGMKNNQVAGLDRQSGPGSLANEYYS